MIISNQIVNTFSYKYLKKILDIIFSIVLIIIFIPIYAIISILIKFSSKGPILYEWNVVGQNGIPFKSWKFRTMRVNADEIKISLTDKNEMIGPVFKMENDPRITKLGKTLRKYSLDESIQFFSVLIGDMSLVGPRPAGPIELKNYKDWQRRRLSVRPGLTGPWQVSGRNKVNHFDDWVKLDLEYIDNWSIWLDIKILFKTIPAAFKGTGM
jgi:lipopolysaccharide/colanic/teichoic acid biosynthesis glycosyltransferase|tara:strand:+ start:1262 stop:1894 length:633 start_codon:yes stop_codon:yes gene_type:complete